VKTSFPKSLVLLLAGAALISLSGCKLEVIVPHGGKVVTEDGSFSCGPSATCVIDVVDLFFDQTFIAVPDEGFEFTHWKENSEGYLCRGETGPCELSTAQLEGSEMGQAILESDETWRLRPRFAMLLGYCPDTGLVVSPHNHSHH